MNRLYAVDVETTGIDPKETSIVSIGAVDIEAPERRYYIECNVWDGAVIYDEALKVNGFTHEEVTSGKIPEGKAIAWFFSWLAEQDGTPLMVAHNAGFDKSFIAEAAKRAGLKNPFSFRTIDIHSIVHMHLTRNNLSIPHNLSLNECLMSFGLEKEPTPHNALTGATCNYQLYNKVKHAT